MDSEHSNQPACQRRLVRVFAGCTCSLVENADPGSNILSLYRDTEKTSEKGSRLSKQFIDWLLQNSKRSKQSGSIFQELAERNANNPNKCRQVGEECGGFHWPCCMTNEERPLCCHFPKGAEPYTPGTCIPENVGIVCDTLW